MTPKMRNVTATASGIDVFGYVAAVPADDLSGHELLDRLVERVYRSEDDRFDHVLVATKTQNVFLTVVVDLATNAVHGHHLLDLDALYGIRR